MVERINFPFLITNNACKVVNQILVNQRLLKLALDDGSDKGIEVFEVTLLDEEVQFVATVLGQVLILLLTGEINPVVHKT